MPGPDPQILARQLFAAVSVAVLFGCTADGFQRAPPLDRLYYPTGLVVSRPAGTTDGFLYVASSNADKRFGTGSLIAIPLDEVGLPAFGDPVPEGGPPSFPDLHIGEEGALQVANFAGLMRAFDVPGLAGPRLFVASRAEENRLHVIDTNGAAIECQASPEARNCGVAALDLTSVASASNGRPQARAPVGIGIASDGKVVVAHESAAKLPQSREVGQFYVFSTTADAPGIATEDFTPITECVNGTCSGGSEAVAVGPRYAFVTGRVGRTNGSQGLPGNLIRWVDFDRNLPVGTTPRVGTAGLERVVQLFEGRGVVLRPENPLLPDEGRLYVVARGFDTLVASGPTMLLAVDLAGLTTDIPRFTIVHTQTLPERCNELLLLPRSSSSELVVLTCGDAGALVVYDSDQRALVANLRGVGNQPFGLAADPRPPGVRFYVSSFVDGQVAVLDLPDVADPSGLRVVARLGRRQACIVRRSDPSCTEDRL